MPTHSLKTRALILCLTLFLAVFGIAAAGAQEDSRIAEAETLIKQKHFSEALQLLVDIQRTNPDLRDKTSRLVAQIMDVKKHFNDTLEQLNKAVQAGDEKKVQALIEELKNTDPEGAGSMLLRSSTLVGFWKLMDSARVLLDARKPREALARYLLALTDPDRAGVRLPSAEFEAAPYGDPFKNSVKDDVATIVKEAQAPPGPAAFRATVSALLARPPADAPQQFDQVTQPVVDAARAEGVVRRIQSDLQEISRSLQLPGKPPDEYLRLLSQLILGRGDGRQEGMALAMHRLWSDDAQWTADTASDAFISAFEQARTSYSAGSLDAADSQFAALSVRATLAAKAAGLAAAQLDVGTAGAWKAPVPQPQLKDLLDRAISVDSYSAEAESYRLLVSYRRDLGSMPAAGGGSAAGGTAAAQAAELSRLTDARTALDARRGDAMARQSAWTARAQALQSLAGMSPSAGRLASSAAAMAERFQSFTQMDLQGKDLQYALRIAALASAEFPRRYQDAVAQRAQAEDLKDGTVNGQAPATGGQPRKRPDLAVPVLTALAGSLDSLISDLTAQEQKLEGEKPWVKASAGFAALFEGTPGRPGYNALLQDARTQRAAVDTLLATAQKQMDAAALASREGDNNFAAAQAAIKRGDPEGATSSLDLATVAYLKSLADSYSDHAYARTTSESDALNARILALQNTISVASAQKALTAINRLVTAGDYLGASDALDSAVRAWSQTQQASYPPFDNLRVAIQNAVEVSRGRQILPADPKADVVNAFVKNARDALAAGRLNDAAQNVKDALAVAPNYGAAKVLELQIKKQTDPAGFQRDAAAQIATYIKMSSDRTNKGALSEAYNALNDYSSLDPKFADQTRATIQELKYELGFQKRPPSAAQVAQAAALVRRADALQQQGTEQAYQQALDLLKAADQITPNNPRVIQLDGLIRTRMGSTALAALSPADTAAYNQALSLFYSGSYQDAYELVLQLWNDARSPRNRTYPQLQRLKKRLEVQLNIS